MITRVWRGRTSFDQADAYEAFLKKTAYPDYGGVEGNRGWLLLRQQHAEAVEFMFVSFWDSMEALRRYAGEDPERPKYYPEDRAMLLGLPERAEHYDVIDAYLGNVLFRPALTNHMHIHTNNKEHLSDFVRLNEIWIKEHFALEETDKILAANPSKIIDEGGFIFSITHQDKVVGACALFKETSQRYELARMAVEPSQRGKGYGHALMKHALQHAKSIGATSIHLYSNTVLEPAIALYKRFGFVPISDDLNRTYARCNIVMERAL